jgi:arsenite-transporting ATPase
VRILLITGGGGAGTSTFAAASAAFAAAQGLRVNLLTAEIAALDQALGPEEMRPPGLVAAAAAPETVFDADAPAVLGWLRSLLSWIGLDAEVAQDLALVPGTRPMAALLLAAAAAEEFDLTVVDLGPVGAALPLLHLLATDPEGEGGADPVTRTALVVVRPVVERLIDLPRPGRSVREAGRRAAARMARFRALLRDGRSLSVRVVLPPDGRCRRIEQEARTVLGLNGIGLDALVERAPEIPTRHHAGTGGGTRTGAGGRGGPVRLAMPWLPPAAAGCTALERLAATVYGDRSPADLLAPPLMPHLEMTDAGADLVVPVPERAPTEFAVSRRDARLALCAGGWRRTFLLPAAFAGLRGRRAWHDGYTFRVRFEP